MEVNRKPNSRDDPMSDAWSFGSNYHPSSQSRKISVGIVIDSVAKCRTQKAKQAENHAHVAALKTSNKGTSAENGGTTMARNKRNFTNDRKKKEIGSTSAIREPTEQQTSPWISTKTLHHEPNLEPVTPAEKPSIVQGVVEMSNRSNRVEVGPVECSLRAFLIQTRTLQFDKSKQVKENAAVEEMPEKEVKGKNDKPENAGSETLRLKLWEILGNVSSQNKQCPNSPVLEQDANASHPEHKDTGYHVDEPRENSDTIESDTQSHEYAIRRAVTRSLARKRAPAKLKSYSRKRPPACKEDGLEKNPFLSKDRWSRTLCDAGTDSSLMENGRRGKRKSHQMDASKICEQNNVMKDEDASNSHKRVPLAEKFVFPGVAAGNGTTLFEEEKDEMDQPNADNLESPVVEMTEQLRNLQEHVDQHGNSADKSKRKALDSDSDEQIPTLAMKAPSRKSFPGFAPRSNQGKPHGDVHEHITSKTEGISNVKSSDSGRRSFPGFAPRSNLGQPHGDVHEHITSKTEGVSNVKSSDSGRKSFPGFALRSNLGQPPGDVHEHITFKTEGIYNVKRFGPGRKSFPEFAPRSNLGQPHGDVHEHITSKTEGICKVKSFDGLKREYKSNALDESSDDAGKLGSSPFSESRPIKEEDTQFRFSRPSSMESDAEGSEDSSNIQGGIQTQLSPENGNTKEQEAPRLNKRLFDKDDANLSGVNLAAASSKGIDCRKLERYLAQNEEDALTSAMTLFAISLEKVRSKIKSVTNQRSAEILESVAENIHTQLQNAEFQIKADMGKITSLNKSKRKHVEEVLQAKQQHLNAIYERFKEEVNQHLQDCKSTLESLEAHEVEVKATVEKRKASSRKLLLEAEEAIETQLDYAERRINSIHHVAREKMCQLKLVVAECLKEGVLG
ncbi:PREDICTED: uncharacterized protein LOC109229550 isoform X1 [Nicotiana attenuata]|uniref:Meiosis-specific protein ASY3-like coiled-coil domain-containing protein n=1 Tax=Nicotiana attenuata TaxID=49451 RepID=A0A1J6IU94_NICAT|nr:PREDICTED: uncharacterized protein LOC109229550 isoform X1 [Nicotiana attenuata]XP_019250584.1 PREDICTED: uncharacterized protein LOC109229550 isoform X1 [Nicotiana attenuata]OIT08414.1 hypothetical protein A4A49_22654 [Nicotiana attenuata]